MTGLVLPDAAIVVDLLHGLIEDMAAWAPPAAVTRIAWDWHARTLALTVADRDAADALAHTMRLGASLTDQRAYAYWCALWEGLDVTITPGSAS